MSTCLLYTSRCNKEDLAGGTPEENAQITLRILNGEKGPKRDAVLMNAGAAIYLAGKATCIREGIEQARRILDSGEAREQLEKFAEYSNQAADGRESA